MQNYRPCGSRTPSFSKIFTIACIFRPFVLFVFCARVTKQQQRQTTCCLVTSGISIPRRRYFLIGFESAQIPPNLSLSIFSSVFTSHSRQLSGLISRQALFQRYHLPITPKLNLKSINLTPIPRNRPVRKSFIAAYPRQWFQAHPVMPSQK